MRDRLADWGTVGQASDADTGTQSPGGGPDPVADAVSGLVALGYKPQEASRFVHAVESSGMTSEEIIRDALKALVKT